MRSTFLGLSLANTALAAQRRAIETAGHNVANANTKGYTRQKVDLSALSASTVAFHSGNGYAGGGVSVDGISRITDQFLIARANREASILGSATEQQTTLSRIEASFAEPSDNGLESQLERFWSAWDTVALTPEDDAARAVLLQTAEGVAEHFHSLSTQWDALSSDALERTQAMIYDINGIATQIADINGGIAAAAAAGAPPLDLYDTRDQLVRQMAEYVNVTTRVDDLGMMSVNIGGAALVVGDRAQTVSLDGSTPNAAVLRMSGSTIPLSTTSGRLHGLLESTNTIIPGQQSRLDAVAVQLRDAVNAQHALGQDLDGNPGAAFFGGTDAKTHTLTAAVRNQPRAVAAALAVEGAFSGNNAIAMAELANTIGGPDDSYRAMLADVGVQAQAANQRYSLQTALSRQVDAQKSEVTDVSIDEEMAMLVAYQQSYDASARFMTAIDEMIERLINGTGTVGR